MTDSSSEPVKSALDLRAVTEADLPVLFIQQLDPEANQMAAFTAKDPSDREAFMAHWARILRDETITKRIILYEGQVAGYLVAFHQDGIPEVGYWIGKEFWGRGIATRALSAFLGQVKVRPLYAHAARAKSLDLALAARGSAEAGAELRLW